MRSVSSWYFTSAIRTGSRGAKTNSALQLIGPAAHTFVTAPACCRMHDPLRVPQRLPKNQALQRKAAHSHPTVYRIHGQDLIWHFRSHSVPWPSRLARRSGQTPRARAGSLYHSTRFAECFAPSPRCLRTQYSPRDPTL
ncbi:hypothetical protein TRVL_08960 [Trypanosoma vivax]|nr:hypothetical protein TRVL_08960 [Trypanosoma vivax]